MEYVEVDLSVGTVLNDYGHLLPNCYYEPLLDSVDVTRLEGTWERILIVRLLHFNTCKQMEVSDIKLRL